MSEQRLQVKRDGEFTYPIVFYRDFASLSQEIKALPNQGKRLKFILMSFPQEKKIKIWKRSRESTSF